MEKNMKVIFKVNGVDILATTDDFIPILPLCKAIGVDYQDEFERLKKCERLDSTVTLRVTVAADGKRHEMLCFPFKYAVGWLFSLHPDLENESARDELFERIDECYEGLTDYYFDAERRQLMMDKEEVDLLKRLVCYIEQRELANNKITEIECKLDKLRQERLNDEPGFI